LPRDDMRKRGLCRRAVFVCSPSVCLSVCLSVTFVYSVEMNFSPSGSGTILVFPYQTLLWQYSNGEPPNRGFECRWGRQKPRFSTIICLYPDRQVVTQLRRSVATGKLVTLITASFVVRLRRTTTCDKQPRHCAEDNRTPRPRRASMYHM